MNPLRVLLAVSLILALGISWLLGAALLRAGSSLPLSIVVAGLAFVAVLVPWAIVTSWAARRAEDLEELTERARSVAEGHVERSLTDHAYSGELIELARAIEEIRSTLVRRGSAYQEHRAAMDQIVSSLGEGLLAVNRQGRIVVANPRVGRMFGSGPDLVGRTVLEVVRKRAVAAAVEKALDGEPATDRVDFTSGHQQRRLEVRTFPVQASPEIAAVALFIDVTAIERLERIRRDFLDDFSHEVRTPLAGLRSAAETLEQGGLALEHEQHLQQIMHRQIARIEKLVAEVSELNQIESGQVALHRRPVNLRQLITEISEELAERNVDIEIEGESVAIADPSRAQQVFTNLLINACTHGGGGAVFVTIFRDGGDAVVRVADQGPGIPPSEMERIFNRFYRVDRSRSQPGSGLGLAIAKHLVAAQGGSISAGNRPEGGAVFEVRLPGA
jgi:two-component system phosphate regulon sensor histidine kinase PhoR